MRPQKQTQFMPPTKLPDGSWELPPGDQIGNCFAACVASLLDLELAEVPNFVAAPGDWWASFQDWLLERGLYALEVEINNERPYLWPLPGEVYCIVNGQSPRGEYGHSVIVKTVAVASDVQRDHKFEWVHDPHPSNEYVVEPYRSLTFLVGRDVVTLRSR